MRTAGCEGRKEAKIRIQTHWGVGGRIIRKHPIIEANDSAARINKAWAHNKTETDDSPMGETWSGWSHTGSWGEKSCG